MRKNIAPFCVIIRNMCLRSITEFLISNYDILTALPSFYYPDQQMHNIYIYIH